MVKAITGAASGPKLKAGEWVEVRSREEILGTLDASSQFEGMPFMPEMFAFCGRRFQVYKSAHKTCDTVFPVRGRRVHRAVHLETRCDGAAHGGCQAGCLIFWKEAWLKRVDGPAAANQPPAALHQIEIHPDGGAENQPLVTKVSDPQDAEPQYVCQATQLPYATSPLEWWHLSQYVEDVLSGNVSLWLVLRGMAYSMYDGLINAGIGLGRPLRWLYNAVNVPLKGTRFPRETGKIPDGEPTPKGSLDLQPGELVRVKSHQAILETLNTKSRNRGMYWDAEMVPYCGKTYRVRTRVTQIIDEKTGKMQLFKSPCVILDSVVCESRYSNCRMFCPRAIYPYWREIWLERVVPSAEQCQVETVLTAK